MPRIGQGVRAGQPFQLDDTDKLAVSMYGQSTVPGDTAAIISSVRGQLTTAHSESMTQSDGLSNFGHTPVNITGTPRFGRTVSMLSNGSTWDRPRNNIDAQILASAARTATLNSADQINYNGRGVIITLDVTAVSATPSITLRIQHKDNESSAYENLLIGAAVTAIGVHTYIVYPAVAAAAEDIVETIGFPLGRQWRVRVEHGDADSITYSVGAAVIL